MEKRWLFKDPSNTEETTQLSESINVSHTIATILTQRGIKTFDQAKSYFRPQLEDLHDPFLMKDMTSAVNILIEAVANGDKIMVYGDYDVDGTCSVSLFYGFLQTHHSNMEFYIPDRYNEGYGISEKGINYAIENKFNLIVSIDCGIKALDRVAHARDAGIDFIICDHHKPGTELPNANAILNPKQSDCQYPFDELCGCGVAFKLLQAFCIQNTIDQNTLFEYLDFVCIATASDIVPMVGENRILTYHGIEVLKTKPKTGLRAIMSIAGMDETNTTVSKIVFAVGPRINAAGRLDHAKGAVSLMLEKDYRTAMDKAYIINTINQERRELDTSITQEALEMIETTPEIKNAKSTVLYKPTWHKGVIGIVASRCIEHYYRPTIILAESDGKASGSARSVAGFDVHDAIDQCSDLLLQYGGHKYAAGLTLAPENIPAFRKKFDEVVCQSISEEQLIPSINIDTEIDLSTISKGFYNILSQMAPFGPKNMTPVFVAKNVFDTGNSRVLKNEHLKLEIRQEGSLPVQAIAFGMAAFYEQIKHGDKFDICFTVEINTFRGESNIQLMVKDIKTKLSENTPV